MKSILQPKEHVKARVSVIALAAWTAIAPAFGLKPSEAINGQTAPTGASAPEPKRLAGSSDLGPAGKQPLSEMLDAKPAPRRQDLESATGEILIKLKKGSPASAALQTARGKQKDNLQSALSPTDSLGQLLSKHGVRELKDAFRVAGKPEAAKVKAMPGKDSVGRNGNRREDLFRWYRLSVATNTSFAEMAVALKAHADVERVEPNYLYRLADEIPPPITSTNLPDATTDPDIDTQWHLDFSRVYHAWNYLEQMGQYPGGSRDVVVAVIDSGVDADHEDLVANIWTNSGEIPGNDVDDDGNGFVDDIHGCSVVSDSRSHSGDSSDYHGHGTHVSGIIAATAFNHKGGVGVAFNVQVMAVRAAQYSGTLTSLDISEGVLYAIDNGAEVINMSFGGYGRSQVMEDALEVALSQAVLVAAAGNNSGPQMYPAALPWVIGVAACTPTGKKAWFSNEGDVRAPGVSIFSTLPGNSYAAWSGTSMAAPVISGIGALMRSYFWQRDIYSVRFLMGGLYAAGADAYTALTVLPTPGVTMLENWLFDDTAIAPGNDGDGRVDSGETLHLAIEVINRSGMAKNVQASLRAYKDGAIMDDPYVTIVNGAANFGDIGPWNTADNGFIYNSEGVITGVTSPLVFQVDPNCPNDHIIPFIIQFTFQDGWDTNLTTYTRYSRFNYIVQRGKNVPTVISSNFTLTADEYWMVAGPVMVEPGATLTIEPGTQVQWGAISDDPYNPGPQNGYIVVRGALAAQGTATNPISFFPSYLVAGQVVTISVEGGPADLRFARVRNPNLNGFRSLDHVYFEWDTYASTVRAQRIVNSVFHKFRGGGAIYSEFGFHTCLFDAGRLVPESRDGQLRNCVFLQDNENDMPLSFAIPFAFSRRLSNEGTTPELFYLPRTTNGETFVVLPIELGDWRLAETIAGYYGGHVTSIRNQQEWDFMRSYLQAVGPLAAALTYFNVGLTDQTPPGTWAWLDGSPLDFTSWLPGEPDTPFLGLRCNARVCILYGWGEQDWGWAVDPINPSWRDRGNPNHWQTYVLRLPGEWTTNALVAPIQSGEMLEYVKQHFPGAWRHNAFLNKYWDPNVTKWMRFLAPNGPDYYCTMRETFWGTDSKTLINHAIIDYYDNFLTARVEYGDPPAHGFETTYPFVESVLVNNLPLPTVPQVEGGPATFTVSFNRDMNTNIEPFVSFGPSPPHTDFQVKPRDENFFERTNGWINARTWEGHVWITPVTGNGYHLMRISGAVAADDPWLVSGYDVGRFRFRVQTVGVAAMTLQANGGEGYVELLWQQNDYDLLAGYNLYRADNIDGPYTRLNATVIPPGQEQYLDTNVVPAMAMFYKFTVVTTDFQESEPSNIASAAAFDTVAPVLAHTPVTTATPGRQLRLTAVARDNVRVTAVVLHYRTAGSPDYAPLSMVNIASNDWSATIPASTVQPPGLEYYLVASDGISQVYSGTAATPHSIVVSDQPTLSSATPNYGPASGGTPVTLAGLQFQADASVLFGGILASNIVVLSANQINCVTPPHFPAMVEVKVMNTNQTYSTLLNGFTYESTGTVLSLPVTSGDFGTTVELALSAANVVGLRAADLVVRFDPGVLSAQSARLGPLVAGWSFTANTATPGRVVLSLANPTSVTGSGTLAYLSFHVLARPPAVTALTLTNILLNDGAMAAETSPGQFTVNGFWSIAGTVRYFHDARPVRNASMSLVGVGTHVTLTHTDGTFLLTNLPTGSYTLTPNKSDEATAITSYDASLVLQSAAGLLELSSDQRLAGDVNRNSTVSSMDAAYILEKAVGLIEVPFPNAGKVWDFLPLNRSYPGLNSDLAGQDFTAVLIGDVSGNWSPEQPGPPLRMANQVESGSSPAMLLALDTGMVRSNRNMTRVIFRSNADALAIYSVDLVLAFSVTSAAVLDVRKASAADAWLLASNTNQPGIVRVALASATALAREGALLALTFSNNAGSQVQILSALLNEGVVPVQLTNAHFFDADGDGLLDLDELTAYHTDPQRRDSDDDGLTDGDEIRAGTDPTRSNSVLEVEAIESDSGTVTLTWASVPFRRYQLEYTDLLEPSEWHSLGPVIDATNATTTVTDASARDARKRLYRVRLVEEQ